MVMVSGSEPAYEESRSVSATPSIEPEQIGFLGVAVLDEHDDVVDRGGEVGRDQVERVAHQFVKPLRAHPHGHGLHPWRWWNHGFDRRRAGSRTGCRCGRRYRRRPRRRVAAPHPAAVARGRRRAAPRRWRRTVQEGVARGGRGRCGRRRRLGRRVLGLLTVLVRLRRLSGLARLVRAARAALVVGAAVLARRRRRTIRQRDRREVQPLLGDVRRRNRWLAVDHAAGPWRC